MFVQTEYPNKLLDTLTLQVKVNLHSTLPTLVSTTWTSVASDVYYNSRNTFAHLLQNLKIPVKLLLKHKIFKKKKKMKNLSSFGSTFQIFKEYYLKMLLALKSFCVICF